MFDNVSSSTNSFIESMFNSGLNSGCSKCKAAPPDARLVTGRCFPGNVRSTSVTQRSNEITRTDHIEFRDRPYSIKVCKSCVANRKFSQGCSFGIGFVLSLIAVGVAAVNGGDGLWRLLLVLGLCSAIGAVLGMFHRTSETEAADLVACELARNECGDPYQRYLTTDEYIKAGGHPPRDLTDKFSHITDRLRPY